MPCIYFAAPLRSPLQPWALCCVQLYRTIFWSPVGSSYLTDSEQPLYCVKTEVVYFTVTVADLLVVRHRDIQSLTRQAIDFLQIYRLYIVWQDRKWIVCIPLLSLVGAVGGSNVPGTAE